MLTNKSNEQGIGHGPSVCTGVKEDAIIGHLNPKTRVMKEARQDHINAGTCSPKPKTSFQI